MRNRTFSFSGLESAWLKNYKSDNWKGLTKKYSGKRLFLLNYFNLINGDMSVLNDNRNGWLLENILNHSATNKDKNFIPVLKKIAEDSNTREAVRQRSVEILEMPWVGKNSFTETRTPQTSEILKLLKVNSVESKRLAICMIGKFKMTDMLQDVADCLSIPGLETDSAAILLSFSNKVGRELQQLYLRSSGNIKTSKAILRILCKTGIQENIVFLYERLWSNSKEIKEVALDCLVDCNFRVPEEEKQRINQLICEVTQTLVWILSARILLKKSGVEFLIKPLDKEIIYWKRFLFGLLFITYQSGRVDSYRKVKNGNDADICRHLPELFDIIFREPGKKKFSFLPPFLSDEKLLLRINRIFPGKMPDHISIIEDLINRDYNHISLWTKSCALRCLNELKDKNLEESAAALIFSPEQMLQEEAARLTARSSIEKYRSVSQRAPAAIKAKLDRIVNGDTPEMELLFEKTNFLSGLFPEISEDKLLFLAKEMGYMKRIPDDYIIDNEGILLWSFRSDAASSDVSIIFESGEVSRKINPPEGDNNIYVLPLKAIEDYHYMFPENSFAILKYIDDHE
jgi:hypothetical protein